jgi:hypothetical protein
MINGPSDDESVGAGADGTSLDAAGASVGDGSTFVTEYFAEDEADPLEAGSDDEMAELGEGVDVGTALDMGVDVGCATLETTGDVAYADEEIATEGATACDEDTEAEETTGVSAGSEDGDGKTVVYCVTMTTGGTCKDVEGKSSTDGDATTED